jgi:hypothetical protein
MDGHSAVSTSVEGVPVSTFVSRCEGRRGSRLTPDGVWALLGGRLRLGCSLSLMWVTGTTPASTKARAKKDVSVLHHLNSRLRALGLRGSGLRQRIHSTIPLTPISSSPSAKSAVAPSHSHCHLCGCFACRRSHRPRLARCEESAAESLCKWKGGAGNCLSLMAKRPRCQSRGRVTATPAISAGR